MGAEPHDGAFVIAQALRNGHSTASIDGQLANATLLALTNRQRTAIAALDAMTLTTTAAQAWQRALRMRVTEDWRPLAMPFAATRLEKLAYFRARRHTVRAIRGAQELTDMREPPAVDFARILQSRSFGVEDGQQFVTDGLLSEIGELRICLRAASSTSADEGLPASIVNARAGRLLAGGDPQVIPWGAWAEFTQRHIGQSIDKIDHLYRGQLGTPGARR